MKKTIYLFASILILSSILSCSSDDNRVNNTLEDNFKDRSLLKSVRYTFKDSPDFAIKYSLSYDTSGNLQSLVSESNSLVDYYYENYNWSLNNIQIEYNNTFDDNEWRTENFTRNSNGYITSGEINYTRNTHSITQHYNCAYNENNQLKQIIISSTDGNNNLITGQTNFTWENGNIVLVNKSNHLYELEYYEDKEETRDVGLKYISVNDAYYTELPGVFYTTWYGSLRGSLYTQNPMFLSKNLLKKYFDGTITIEYFYDFDSKGRVIRQSHTSSESYIENLVLLYEYFD